MFNNLITALWLIKILLIGTFLLLAKYPNRVKWFLHTNRFLTVYGLTTLLKNKSFYLVARTIFFDPQKYQQHFDLMTDFITEIFMVDNWKKRIIHIKQTHFAALISLIVQFQKEYTFLEANRTWTIAQHTHTHKRSKKSSYRHNTCVLLLWFALASSSSSFKNA